MWFLLASTSRRKVWSKNSARKPQIFNTSIISFGNLSIPFTSSTSSGGGGTSSRSSTSSVFLVPVGGLKIVSEPLFSLYVEVQLRFKLPR